MTIAGKFGLVTADQIVTGVTVTNISHSSTGNTKEFHLPSGYVGEVKCVPSTQSVKIDGEIQSTYADAIKVGATITYNTVSYTVTGVDKNQPFDDFHKFSCSAVAPIPEPVG